ncbi:MAG: SDR family oxidoreductase [Halioglobus sp.]|nr:SDR family oxidoreductase [Halioglobus sp.]
MNLKAPDYVEGHGLIKGRSVLITAAAGAGIGFAAATKAVEEGARAVVLSDIHEGRLQKAVEQLQSDTGLDAVYGKLANVAVEDDVRALVDYAEDTLSGIDILINNAGLGTSKLLVEMEDDEWHKVIDVTLNGTMRMTRYMMKVMQGRGAGGVIVNNASVLGWRAQKEQAHYAAAKAGVMALTRCAALEAAEYDVRINAVAPSIVLHPMLRKSASEELLEELESKEAYGRAAEAWEVANVMMFLASDYSSYMTGEIVSVSSQRS